MKLLINGKYEKVSFFSLLKCNLLIELGLSAMLVAGIFLAKGFVLLVK